MRGAGHPCLLSWGEIWGENLKAQAMRQFLLTEGSSNFIMDAVSESEQMTKRRLIAQQIEVASLKSKKKLDAVESFQNALAPFSMSHG